MSDFIVEHLTKSVGDKTVFRDISFIMHDYDRIGIIGVNGTGKTTLLDVISGRLGFDGDVSPFSAKNGYKIAYLTQEPDFDDNKTILDTVLSSDLREMALIKTYEQLMADYNESNQAQLEKVMAEMDSLDAWTIESEVKTVLTKLGLHDLSQKVGDLSGGLRRRVQLAQVLLNDADLLLLDEPTNHLDIEAKEVLEKALKDFDGTLLFVSHDRYFINQLANKIVSVRDGHAKIYNGNYSYYLDEKAKQANATASATEDAEPVKAVSEQKLSYQEQKQRDSQKRKLQRAIDQAEKEIEDLEAKEKDIQNEMANPEIASNFDKLGPLQEQLDEIQKQLDTANNNWEKAIEELDNFE